MERSVSDFGHTAAASLVAQNLKTAQREAGMPNETLARAVGVGLRMLQKWRAGDSRPSQGNIARLAEVLKRDPTWFYEDHNDEAAA